MTTSIASPREGKQVYRPSPNILQNVIYARDPELIVSGPAGTGKSRAILEKIFMVMAKYPMTRALIFRKIKATLNNTGLITWERYVLPRGLGVRRHSKLDNYTLPNGSVLDVAGMDDPEKIKSGEWDIIFGQEITECDEADWDLASSRVRAGMPDTILENPYKMLIGDCNPSHPKHWAKVRTETLHPDPEVQEERPGATRSRMVKTFHTDNPVYYDRETKTWTKQGKEYLSRLRALTGVTKLRLYDGLWVAAEGLVYDAWEERIHLLPESWSPPDDWPRIWAIDFGFSAPFVWGEWVIDPLGEGAFPKGSIILNREIYQTRTLVEDHAATIKGLGYFQPKACTCDHDAEDRATFERHIRVATSPAYKDIPNGIQKVKERIRHDIRTPRLYIRRGARVHPADPWLVSTSRPTSTEEEVTGYVWNKEAQTPSTLTTAAALKKVEYPLQVNDHGMDMTRYAVCHLDVLGLSDGVYF